MAHPLNLETRDEIEKIVLQAYGDAPASGMSPASDDEIEDDYPESPRSPLA